MKLSSLYLPLLGIAVGLASCSVERTAYVNGSTIEWSRKHSSPVERKDASAPKVTAASYEVTAERVAPVEAMEAAPSITAEVVKEAAVATGSKRVARAANKVMSTNAAAVTVGMESIDEEGQAWSSVGAPAKAAKGGGKSQLIALILCVVVGGLGIHRFYLGYIWQGVVQLLTAGGCGVWALIDLVRIIMGTLEPKDGRYSQTL